MKFSCATLGCKVNQYETQCLKELLLKSGLELCDRGEAPDLFLLNSCTVTAESDRKTRQMLHSVNRKFPSCKTVLFGCMAQNQPEKAAELGADILFGNTDHKKLFDAIMELINEGKTDISPEEHTRDEGYKTPSISTFSERTRAYMKIEDGCNRFCSYCAIPYARGRVRSRSIEDIRAEARALAQNGYREIVLVSINLSAFGQGSELSVCDAVSAVAKTEGVDRVRLGSLEPDHISDEILESLSKTEKFCPQFHLSLQSGCDETLKRMNRHYDTALYRDLVERIRNKFENPSITTDIMVGFSGESEEEFEASRKFVSEIGFAKCHIFAYSKREGTAAAKLSGQIENREKQKRAALMLETALLSQRRFLENMKGRVESVLFETEKDGYIEGYTENYTRVRVKTEKNSGLSNDIYKVSLQKVIDDHIEGTLLKEI